MDLRAAIVLLRLRHPFGLSRGTAHELPTVLVRLGEVGVGEAAPVRYLGQTAPDALPILAMLAAATDPATPDDPAAIVRASTHARALAPAHSAARAAIDIALWDAAARRRGLGLRELLADPDVLLQAGLSRHDLCASTPAAQTSFTVALDELPAMAARAAEAAHMPVLKVKLGRGLDFDRAALLAVAAAAPRARLRVDANGGWSPDDARAIAPLLVSLGVEQLEQPLAAGRPDLLAALARAVPLPIYADEDVQSAAELPTLAGAVAGVNVKLMKCGGISPALAMIAAARRHGLQVLLGCMIESRVGLAAAAALADFADSADLDAHMLTTADPTPPGSQAELRPELPALPGPGLGVPAAALPLGGPLPGGPAPTRVA